MGVYGQGFDVLKGDSSKKRKNKENTADKKEKKQ